ncbi:hypothetical protein FQA39_LY06312 [Lamprigera yunnana]|nr:hypothetical protein FQA39_LY06312 [Lamprigera yunnana]
MKLLILSLCLNVATSILTVPNENYGVKKCVQNIIENAVPLDTTVLYVYDKVFDDVLPDKIQHPFLTFNISKKQYIVSGYRSYNEMVILYIKSASFLKDYLTKMRQHVWKFKSLAKRRYLIIYPSEEVSELKEIFSQFLKLDADDVIVATYNFTLKKEAVKVFTWNPYHPSNKCGTIFNFRKEEFCSSVKMIENRRKLKNFNKCNMTYCYDVDRRYKNYVSEVAYVTNFLLEIMDQALNLTIVPSIALFEANGQNDSLYTKMTNKFHIISFRETIHALRNQTALEHNSVFIIFDVLYETVQKYKPKLYTIVDSKLIGEEQRTYSTKNESSFLPILNDIISILLESGLINLKQMEYKRYISKFEHFFDNKLNTTEENVVLGLNHVYPILAFWVLIMSLQAIVDENKQVIFDDNGKIFVYNSLNNCATYMEDTAENRNLLNMPLQNDEMIGQGSNANCYLYGMASECMAKKGYMFTGVQCDIKFRNLKKTYKRIIDNNKGTGNGAISWPYFDLFDSLFGKSADTVPIATASNTDGYLSRCSTPGTPDTSVDSGELIESRPLQIAVYGKEGAYLLMKNHTGLKYCGKKLQSTTPRSWVF